MVNVILVGCGRKKGPTEGEAQYMYVSPLFRKARDYAIASGDPWYILSGKHGLLDPSRIIQPYDRALRRMNKTERKHWAHNVARTLREATSKRDTITILAGALYQKDLIQELQRYGYSVSTPIKGLAIGKQMHWLDKKTPKNYRFLNRFYDALSDLEEGLGGKRKLGDCDRRMSWPHRGVYFFFEDGEIRKGQSSRPRVVRVGTHAVSFGSKSTLWGRLKTHKGSFDGSGNHRSSIFRLHVGQAILNKTRTTDHFPNWGKGMSASAEIRAMEKELEIRVSRYLSEMRLLWVEVNDPPTPSSDRAFIERNAIALLSNHENPFDSATKDWLGNLSASPAIKRSGLWNIQGTKEKYDPRFLKIFKEYVDITLGREPKPRRRLAPRWHKSDKRKTPGHQLNLDRFGE